MFGFSCYFQVQCCRMAGLTETPAGLDVELQTLLQHTEVRWLAIRRVLRPWDAVCDFVKDLEKDEKNTSESIKFTRVPSDTTSNNK